MNTSSKVLSWAIGLIVLVGVLAIGAYATATPASGASINRYEAGVWQFGNGFYAGTTQQFSVDASGNVTTTGTFAATGAITGSAAATVGVLTQGGGITASSTSASVTLAGTEFTTSNVLDYTVNVGSPTLTLSASTTSICPATTGQSRELLIRHATTTATSNLVIAGGTGTLLKKIATSTGTTIYGDTDGGNYAQLTVTRKANTDCEVLLRTYTD
jgi:hypothetical protein